MATGANSDVVRAPEGANRRQGQARDDRSPEAKRRRRDDDAHHRRHDDDAQKRRTWYEYRTSKRNDNRGSVRASRGIGNGRRASHLRPSENREQERVREVRRPWSRPGYPPPPEQMRLPVPCTEQAQSQSQSVATVDATSSRVVAVDDSQPQQEPTEQWEEMEWRRRKETQRKREDARREVSNIVRTVYFNDPYDLIMDIHKLP